jgi:hypothetical protein
MNELPFHALLYRCFFYDFLFRDASRGSAWERAAALRHNRQQARWLPTYMRRMTVLGLLMYGVATFIEVVLQSPGVSAVFYVSTVMTVPYDVVTGVCWWWLVYRQA